MMSGLRFMVDGVRLLPFVSAFYGQRSTYLWEDDVGEVHSIPQGEGGEQRDRLMPLLLCLGQHSALSTVSEGLQEGERLFAYLETCTWFANQTGWEQFTTSSVCICGTTAEFPSMQARPRCGPRMAPTYRLVPVGSLSKGSGVERGRRPAHRSRRIQSGWSSYLVTQHTSRSLWRRGLRTTECCQNGSQAVSVAPTVLLRCSPFQFLLARRQP